jgi:HK97 family phage prohead protease
MTNEKLHPKVLEHRAKSKSINHRALAVNEYGALSTFNDNLDKRIVEGYLVIWMKRNLYGEKFLKGAYAKTINEWGPGSSGNYKTKFLNQHDPKDPLGLFDVLEEDEQGLYFKTKPLDDVPSADRVLRQIRSGTLNNYSQGFNPVWNKSEYDESDDSIVHAECKLFEGSPVSIPVDMDTYTIRSIESLNDLNDDTEDFIMSLPRKIQIEARNLFARHKSLVDIEPNGEIIKRNSLNETKPIIETPAGIDFDKLLKLF